MNLLLTGHEGYVGAALFRYLGLSHSVIGWGRKEDLLRLDEQTLKKHQIQAIINCATVMDRLGVGYSIGSPSDQVNVQGVRHLLGVIRGTGIRLIHISTKDVFGAVYGVKDVVESELRYEPTTWIDDERAFRPETVYAKSKLMSEWMTESHPYSTVIRLSTCYTDSNHPRGHWMLNIIKRAFRELPIQLTGTGKQVRDPLHVEDLAQLIELLLDGRGDGLKFNAGGGEGNIISLREYVMAAVPKARIEYIPGGDLGFVANNRMATSLGWVPKVRVRDRIPLILAAARQAIESERNRS